MTYLATDRSSKRTVQSQMKAEMNDPDFFSSDYYIINIKKCRPCQSPSFSEFPVHLLLVSLHGQDVRRFLTMYMYVFVYVRCTYSYDTYIKFDSSFRRNHHTPSFDSFDHFPS